MTKEPSSYPKIKKRMDDFGYKVIEDVYKERQKHGNIIAVLNKGKSAVENNDLERAREVLYQLQFLQSLPEQQQVFSSKKGIDVRRLSISLESLIKQQAQIVQNTK